jgi:hypothetical protein
MQCVPNCSSSQGATKPRYNATEKEKTTRDAPASVLEEAEDGGHDSENTRVRDEHGDGGAGGGGAATSGVGAIGKSASTTWRGLLTTACVLALDDAVVAGEPTEVVADLVEVLAGLKVEGTTNIAKLGKVDTEKMLACIMEW